MSINKPAIQSVYGDSPELILKSNLILGVRHVMYAWYYYNPEHFIHNNNPIILKSMTCVYDPKNKVINLGFNAHGDILSLTLRKNENKERVVNVNGEDHTFKLRTSRITISGFILDLVLAHFHLKEK